MRKLNKETHDNIFNAIEKIFEDKTTFNRISKILTYDEFEAFEDINRYLTLLTKLQATETLYFNSQNAYDAFNEALKITEEEFRVTNTSIKSTKLDDGTLQVDVEPTSLNFLTSVFRRFEQLR